MLQWQGVAVYLNMKVFGDVRNFAQLKYMAVFTVDKPVRAPVISNASWWLEIAPVNAAPSIDRARDEN